MRTKTPPNDQTIAVRINSELREKLRQYTRATDAVSEAEALRYIISRFFSEGSQHEVDNSATGGQSA